MTKQEKVKRARRWLRDMQKVLPTALPVRLSARPHEGGSWGECSKKPNYFEIRLDWGVGWELTRDFLLPHEYAHARVWGRLQADNLDHDGHFWLEVGKVTEASEQLPYHLEE